MVFRVYGVVCAAFLVLFVLVNLYNRDEGSFTADLNDEVDPTVRTNNLTFVELFIDAHRGGGGGGGIWGFCYGPKKGGKKMQKKAAPRIF